jgi:hypothetical protein
MGMMQSGINRSSAVRKVDVGPMGMFVFKRTAGSLVEHLGLRVAFGALRPKPQRSQRHERKTFPWKVVVA